MKARNNDVWPFWLHSQSNNKVTRWHSCKSMAPCIYFEVLWFHHQNTSCINIYCNFIVMSTFLCTIVLNLFWCPAVSFQILMLRCVNERWANGDIGIQMRCYSRGFMFVLIKAAWTAFSNRCINDTLISNSLVSTEENRWRDRGTHHRHTWINNCNKSKITNS